VVAKEVVAKRIEQMQTGKTGQVEPPADSPLAGGSDSDNDIIEGDDLLEAEN
jgi:hypothetical protein